MLCYELSQSPALRDLDGLCPALLLKGSMFTEPARLGAQTPEEQTFWHQGKDDAVLSMSSGYEIFCPYSGYEAVALWQAADSRERVDERMRRNWEASLTLCLSDRKRERS